MPASGATGERSQTIIARGGVMRTAAAAAQPGLTTPQMALMDRSLLRRRRITVQGVVGSQLMRRCRTISNSPSDIARGAVYAARPQAP